MTQMEFETNDLKANRISQKDETGRIIAEITFPETSPGVFVIDHTFVDESLRGQGMASKLVQAAVNEIKKRGGKVQATCSYAKKWLEEHEI